ncbi:MAG TPA: hypothetical protein VKV80_02800 [Streptosporangiaceae bacterium]|jgi:hypothetical protein|nr:hypothetical protein [Streptosporangiaceae bacterium]
MVPRHRTGLRYADQRSWQFRETVVLPAPFGLEIVTDQWQPWKD